MLNNYAIFVGTLSRFVFLTGNIHSYDM